MPRLMGMRSADMRRAEMPPPVSPARRPPADWGELVQAHFRPGNLSGDG